MSAMGKVFAAALMLAMGSAPAAAQLLGFDELASPDLQDIGTSYVSGDFRIDIAPDPLIAPNAYLLVWGSGDTSNADPGGATLTTGYSGNIVTLSSVSNTPFRFDSIDLTDAFNGIFPDNLGSIGFLLTLADGSSEALTVTLADKSGLQRFQFGQEVLAVSWQGLTTPSQWVQFDNIVLNGGGVVPEPASWAMMIAGFGLVGAMARRRRALPA